MFGYWVDAGDEGGRVVGGGDVVGFRVVDFGALDAWWLITVLVTEPFAVLKLGRTFVLPMALLATIHTAAFGLAAFSFFVGELLEFLSVLWREVGEGDAGGVVRFRSKGANVGAAVLGLGLRGVIGAPALVEFFGERHKVWHGGGCRQDTKDLVVQSAGDVLAKGVHFCGLVGIRAGSVRGSFLVPFREGTVVHPEGVHDIDRVHDRFDGNKVGFKGVFELFPGSKVNRVCCECSLLVVFCPFTSRGS